MDLIDRQAAIDAICNACGKIDCDKMDKCEKLQLPPASSSEFPNNSDVISRRSAIDALRAMQTYKLFAGDDMLLIDQAGAQTELMLLPPIQPKRGKWIKTARWRNVYKCDQCGNYLDFSGVNAGRGDANFCPNCGAKMEVNHEND